MAMKYSSGINPDCATRDGLAGGLARRETRETGRVRGFRERREGVRAEGSRKA